MNLNDEEDNSVFNQHCFELAKLLRTEQTEDFLHLYDSLPSEWNGSRLETAKESIRELQELDENEFEILYQRAFQKGNNEQNSQTIIMSNLPIQSTVIDNHGEQTNNRITSIPILQQKQHIERTTANNLAYDETHFLSIKRNNDESNTKTRRLQPITNNNNTHDMIQNNCRTRTPVDSFVQLNLKPAIDITVEDYKKTRVPTSTTKNSSTHNQPSSSQSIDTNESNQQSKTSSNLMKKKHQTSMKNKSHEEASFDYFSPNNHNDDDDNNQHSRSSSSSSSSSTNNKNDLLINQTLPQSNSFEHSKLIAKNDFDSHGSSIATKSSSDHSGSARTASGSDSDDEHHHHHHHQSEKNIFSLSKNKLGTTDDTPTIVLNKTSDHRLNQYDCISYLPKQDSYELVQFNTNDEHPLLASQVPRFKLPATDDPNGFTNSNNDILCYTTQRSQPNTLSSSHQNRNSERDEPYNINHSNNSSRKPPNRSTKKRKPSQQDIIRTELIPGHRGDRDVDELVMFIDGNSSSKQRQNSAPLRSTDTNKLKSTSSLPDTNSNHNLTSRRKSRKSIKSLQESINNNENKTSQIDDDTQSIGFIDEDDDTTTTTTTTTHSFNEQDTIHRSLPNNDESHLNTTNGETSLPEWLEPTGSTSPSNDNIDSLSLSSPTLNNSNSEIISEPFVTVTHRRRLTKERRHDNNNFRSSYFTNDKRRFQPSLSTQNGIQRPTIPNSLSNIKPFVSTTTKDAHTNRISPPSSQTSILPPSSISNEQSSPRLSSLLKRQSKPPPVVFLNKSIDIELNDVSFGFDIENPLSDNPSTPNIPIEKEPEIETNIQSNDLSTNSKSSYFRRSYQQQRNTRGPLFYSGPDIRPPQHNRNYPTQSPYIDPLLLLQYNQQRFANNYSQQQFAYANLLRTQYLSSQSPYVLIPTTYTNPTHDENKTLDDETSQPTEQIQEPLLVYTTPTGPIYLQSTKKSFNDLEQSSIPTMYPSHYFYPTQTQNIIPPSTAYFQPISSPSLLIDTKSEHDNTEDEEEEEEDINDYNKSTRLFHQTKQSSSSHIMSNALQLVYSQEKRNAQTDRFNLDQLTAYLAMKWTDTIDHYEQGDDGILLMGE